MSVLHFINVLSAVLQVHVYSCVEQPLRFYFLIKHLMYCDEEHACLREELRLLHEFS